MKRPIGISLVAILAAFASCQKDNSAGPQYQTYSPTVYMKGAGGQPQFFFSRSETGTLIYNSNEYSYQPLSSDTVHNGTQYKMLFSCMQTGDFYNGTLTVVANGPQQLEYVNGYLTTVVDSVYTLTFQDQSTFPGTYSGN